MVVLSFFITGIKRGLEAVFIILIGIMCSEGNRKFFLLNFAFLSLFATFHTPVSMFSKEKIKLYMFSGSFKTTCVRQFSSQTKINVVATRYITLLVAKNNREY